MQRLNLRNWQNSQLSSLIRPSLIRPSLIRLSLSFPFLLISTLLTVTLSIPYSIESYAGDSEHQTSSRPTSIRPRRPTPSQILLWGLDQTVQGFDFYGPRDLPRSIDDQASGATSASIVTFASTPPGSFDLVQYMLNNTDPRTAQDIIAQLPRYNRVDMYGGWVNEDSPQNCFNTRMEVLIRDTTDAATIEYAPHNPCNVAKGTWVDPYTSSTFKLSSAIQIDHVVPLKNSYISGAYAWKKERRCHFANYLRNPFHLLAVSGHENMSKGDGAPDKYMPPDSGFKCKYLGIWLKIKAIWNLQFTASEVDAIKTEIKTNSCDEQNLLADDSLIQSQRAESNNINLKCVEAVAIGTDPPDGPGILPASTP